MKLIQVSKQYHNQKNTVQALSQINLTLEPIGITVILGESGCGKSTLLKLIAGEDRAFQGTIERDGSVEIMTQDIQLLEKASILDNLLLVSNDLSYIDQLLTQFHLPHHQQMVKKLSLGEKRRVQMIRSLLSPATYFICDEPTASLDFENRQLVMELLKKMALTKGVIIATHDLAIAEQYGDRIIRMGKGIITDAQPIKNEHRPTHPIVVHHPDWKKQIAVLYRQMSTRWHETLLRYLFLFGMVLCVFILINLYPSLNNGIRAKTNWLYNQNIILSEPVDSTTEQTTSRHLIYDLYQKEDALLAHDVIPELLAYRIGWDWENYSNLCGSSYTPYIQLQELERVVKTYQNAPSEPFPGYQMMVEALDKTTDTAVTDDTGVFFDFQYHMGLSQFVSLPKTEDVLMNDSSLPITAYTLFPDAQLDLMFGKMPTTSQEIVITKNVAEQCLHDKHLDTMEALIGCEIPIKILQYHDPFTTESFGYQPFTFSISGITYDYSQYEYQVFFTIDGYEQMFSQEYHYQPDLTYYQYLHFFLNPKCNSEQIAQRLNHILGSNHSRFQVSPSYEMTPASYQKSSLFLLFTLFAQICLVFLFLIIQGLANKRIKKENAILRHYHYHPWLMTVVMTGSMLGIVFLTHMLCLPLICEQLNQIAHHIQLSAPFTYDVGRYLLSMMITASLVLLLEGGIYVCRTHQR